MAGVAIALVAWLAGPAAADDSPQAPWGGSYPPAAGTTAPVAPSQANSPQSLWAGSYPPSAAGTAPAAQGQANASQSLWAGSYPAGAADNAAGSTTRLPLLTEEQTSTDDPPQVSDPEKLTPSQTFWATVDRGYQAVNPWAKKKGYPGWGPGACFQPTESTWYTRIDYYHWSQQLHSSTVMDEVGPLFTLGYTRMGGEKRFRAEAFGGVVQYQGGAILNNGTTIPLNNHTSYYGGRLEYDLFFNCPNHRNCLFFIGLGTRLWYKDLPDSTIQGNLLISGFRETWLSLYPYIGIETRHDPYRLVEFYGRARIGVTAFNYMYVLSPGSDGLYPGAGVNALLEEGVRYNNFTLSALAEVFTWSRSGINGGYYQEASNLMTIGIKAGYSY
ncbi:MAG TPA: hypothetical protein VHY91_01295 [Pirellulales bacterium]|jgi:hypothetical protein|nr:hypothetical protein [Pirellulales bacterium]